MPNALTFSLFSFHASTKYFFINSEDTLTKSKFLVGLQKNIFPKSSIASYPNFFCNPLECHSCITFVSFRFLHDDTGKK